MRDPLDPQRLIHLLPELSDDAAWQLSQWLRKLSQHFEESCHQQILRAYRKQRRQRQRAAEQRNPRYPQAKLPEEFEQRFWEQLRS